MGRGGEGAGTEIDGLEVGGDEAGGEVGADAGWWQSVLGPEEQDEGYDMGGRGMGEGRSDCSVLRAASRRRARFWR